MTARHPQDDHAHGAVRDRARDEGPDLSIDRSSVEDPPLDTVLRRRRASLRSAMGRLEGAVAAPVRAAAGPWLARVVAETAALHEYFVEHLAATEGPDGYYAGLLAEAPRLAGRIRRLEDEHRRMAAAFEKVSALEAQDPGDELAVDTLREEVLALLLLFARHRQHGSDLLWEAYGFDVGGEA
jgi:hypothetical protein